MEKNRGGCIAPGRQRRRRIDKVINAGTAFAIAVRAADGYRYHEFKDESRAEPPRCRREHAPGGNLAALFNQSLNAAHANETFLRPDA